MALCCAMASWCLGWLAASSETAQARGEHGPHIQGGGGGGSLSPLAKAAQALGEHHLLDALGVVAEEADGERIALLAFETDQRQHAVLLDDETQGLLSQIWGGLGRWLLGDCSR